MMIAQQRFGRILVFGRPVDMRNGFDGLTAIVRRELDEDPLSGDLLVFINARGNLVKALLWDRTGFIVVCKPPFSPTLESAEFWSSCLMVFQLELKPSTKA